MADLFENLTVTPSAPVAKNGTLTFAYPSGLDQNDFTTGGGKLWVDGHETLYDEAAGGFSVAYSTGITVTYLGETSIPAGKHVTLQATRYNKGAPTQPENLPVKTVATVTPAAKAGAGAIVYLSDGAAGSPMLCYSDGTNWKRADTGATAAAS